MNRRAALALALVAAAVVSASATPLRFPVPRHRPTAAGLLGSEAASDPKAPPFKVSVYEQTVDHFNFSPTEPSKFKQRILTNDDFYRPGGPMFFYAGNEGDITMFWDNTGLIFELAEKFNAKIVFAEHRYYGESMPFGTVKESFSKEHVGYLTAEQALADYAEFVPAFKKEHNMEDAPVIVFGGSYGGMLAAWMRIAYPWVVDGAIAASAPILQFEGLTPDNAFYKIVTADFAREKGCAETIDKAFKDLPNVAATAEGRKSLTETFHLCSALGENDEPLLSQYINTALTYMAMTDYPYPSSFLQPMPSWPVKEACTRLGGANDEMEGMYEAMNVYYNYTGSVKCYNISNDDTSGGLGLNGWDYQSCTEMVMPIASNGKTDIFPPAPFSIPAITKSCQKKYGVTPRANWMETVFGGRNLRAASNIVFSNGDLDPWSAGGVLESVNESVVAVVIKDGAHHLDLRFSNPADPPSVKEARKLEVQHITKWIKQKQEATGGPKANLRMAGGTVIV